MSMKSLSLVFAALFSVISGLAGTAMVGPADEPDRVLKDGEWEFQVFYRKKGTRSEGQHGVLIHKAKVTPPGKKMAVKDTPFGKMVFHGNDYENPWETTGWNFKEYDDLLHSRKARHPAEQDPSTARGNAPPEAPGRSEALAPAWPGKVVFTRLDGPPPAELRKQSYGLEKPPAEIFDPDRTIKKHYPGVRGPTGHGGAGGTTVYFIIAKEVFYLRSDCAQGHHDGFLGPFRGDPRIVLAPQKEQDAPR